MCGVHGDILVIQESSISERGCSVGFHEALLLQALLRLRPHRWRELLYNLSFLYLEMLIPRVTIGR